MIPIEALSPTTPGYSAALLKLHRFNEESRWDGDWFVTLSSDDIFVLNSVRSLVDLRPQAVDTWIDEGLHRRSEVAELLTNIIE